ncbi:MAG: T9SS type A sorting domain-containing protein [Flavobacteriales bacterium]|nr:T9SS type A sorting domain-containing protein [Flavobacteriales bacterium]MBP6699319.1 T9SS type A sorting domain-containing protein [Flavobacteriales bacterium]
MKKILTLVGSVALVSSVMGQHVGMPRLAKGLAPEPRYQEPYQFLGHAKGACILSEDFESTPFGQLPAGWSTPDVETQDDNTGVGTGTFVPGYAVTDYASIDALPGNNYFNIPDAPPGNKFAAANDDGDPCNCDLDEAALITPAMDFTGQTEMSVSFRAFSDDSFGGLEGGVDVSTDGGANWANAYTIDPIEATWQNIVVDLSAYDGNPSVTLRFTWNDGTSWAVGQAIDDVCVAPILPNNLTLVKAFTANNTLSVLDETVRSFEYTWLPLEQAAPLEFSARILNNGGLDQTNVVVTASVSFDGGAPVDFASSPIASIASGTSATVAWVSTFTPPSPGNVSVTFTLTADAPDENLSDNTVIRSFEISGPAISEGSNVMARDHNSAASFYGPVAGTEYRVGNQFEIEVPGSTAYGIGVCFGGGPEGTLMQAELLLGFDLSLLEISAEYFLTADDQNTVGGNTFAYLPLATPVALDEDVDVVAVVHHFGGDQVRVAASGVPEDTTAFLQGADGVWSWLGATPMVRLFLGNSVGMEEIVGNGLTLGPNMPNPFNGYTSIQYTLDEAREISLQVVDMNGKVVFSKAYGTKSIGTHLLEFDASQLSAGLYSYSLTAGSTRLTRRMVVR